MRSRSKRWNALEIARIPRMVRCKFPLGLLPIALRLDRSSARRSDPDIDTLLGTRRIDYESAKEGNRISTDRLRICTEANQRAADRILS